MMAHKMGLAKVILETKSVTFRTVTFNSTYPSGNTVNSSSNITASGSFKSYLMWNKNNANICFFVAKSGGTYTFDSTVDRTASNAWEKAFTHTFSVNRCEEFDATVRDIVYTATFAYRNNYYSFSIPSTGSYQIECWGASGGSVQATGKALVRGGYGAYTRGIISLSSTIYVYPGQMSDINVRDNTLTFNGGGGSYGNNPDSEIDGRGGGATDISIANGAWNTDNHKNSRIMVAAGGGGATTYGTNYTGDGTGGNAGGLFGYPGNQTWAIPVTNWATSTEWNSNKSVVTVAQGGSQESGGAGWLWTGTTYTPGKNGGGNSGGFGYGGTGRNEYPGFNPGGGSGWYGGGSSGVVTALVGTGAGGSSFISGFNGCVAKIGYVSSTDASVVKYGGKEYKFDIGTTQMIDGAGYAWTTEKGSLTLMPKPEGGYYSSGEGHTGNGYVRIINAVTR